MTVVPFDNGTTTPALLLEHLGDKVDQMTNLTVIWTDKDKGRCVLWSDQKFSDVIYSSRILDHIIDRVIDKEG